MIHSHVLEPPAISERTRRLLPIAADLLPAEIVDSRRARKVRRSVVVGIVALVAVLTAWYGYAVYQTSVARSSLSGAQSDITRMTKKQDQFTALTQTQAGSAAINGQLTILMTQDLPWSALVGPAVADATDGVQVKQITGDLPDEAAKPTAGGGGFTLPSATKQKLIGKLTVDGLAPDKTAVAKYVDALAQVRGLANPFVTSATPGTDSSGIAFTVQFDITDAVLGGRFSAKTGK